MKELKIPLKALPDTHFLIDLRNHQAKVTMVRIEADRNEYVGTYLKVAAIDVENNDGYFIASVRDGLIGGVQEIYRNSQNLSCIIAQEKD